MTPRFVFRPAAGAELMEAREWYEDFPYGVFYRVKQRSVEIVASFTIGGFFYSLVSWRNA